MNQLKFLTLFISRRSDYGGGAPSYGGGGGGGYGGGGGGYGGGGGGGSGFTNGGLGAGLGQIDFAKTELVPFEKVNIHILIS